MLVSVLLHVGGLITVIIVSVIFSIFSSRKKEKKRASFMEQFIPKPQPFDDIPVDMDPNDIPVDMEPPTFIVNSPENEPAQYTEKRVEQRVEQCAEQPIRKRKHNNQKPTKPAAEPAKPAVPVIDDTQESEYSLNDPEAAKRAIIYSEILKPKF